MINKILAVLLVICAICLLFIDQLGIPDGANKILMIITFVLIVSSAFRGSKKEKNDISTAICFIT